MADRNHGETPRSPIEVQKALKGVSYPADKQTLLETARSNGADKTLRLRSRRSPMANMRVRRKCRKA
jgi:Protein of unknown function (DUF2795)